MTDSLFASARSLPEHIQLDSAELLFWPQALSSQAADQYFQVFQQELAWRQDQIRIAGRTLSIPRLQAWYADMGLDYCYSGLTLHATPWTDNLLAIKQRVENYCQHSFNALLANLYRDGNDSMGWHADDEPELGPDPIIASLSLGEERKFRLRHKKNKTSFELALPHGSLLLMGSGTQCFWQHQIAKSKRVNQARINLTFRQLMQGNE